MSQRITNLQATLAPEEAVLLSQATDVTYFTGFTFLVPEEREALALITHSQAFLFHGRFCPVKKKRGLTPIAASSPTQLADQLARLKTTVPFSILYLDKNSLFVTEYEALQGIKELTLATLNRNTVWSLRAQKDTQEIEALTKASTVAAQSFKALLPQITVGHTEREIQELLEAEMKKRGSEQPAFPTIVAFGDHAALPHHQPTDRTLKAETPILIDFGATIQGYRSDITRTSWFGHKPATEFLKIQKVVQDAYAAALTQLHQPATAKDVDDAARLVIVKAGYGEQFIHTTGHGVGLDIHEQPSLNFKNEILLTPGMVITIEPGIYLEGTFGYRYENTILLTRSKPVELTG